MRALGLLAALFAFWLALSGHYTLFLTSAGLVSAGLVLLATREARTLDEEGQPLERLRGAVTYWPWLAVEIVKSAWNVATIVLSPRMRISPTLTTVRAGQRTPAGIATYANSITLTPGTLTVGVKGQDLTVLALVRENALDLEGGRMDRRVSRFEGQG